VAIVNGRPEAAFHDSAFKDLVIDASDARRMASFWSSASGLSDEPCDPSGEGPDRVLRGALREHTIWVNQVPEHRTAKQRVHLDLHVHRLSDLTELGATVDTAYPHWTVMRDPEGGELCAFERDPQTLPSYRIYELVVDCVDPASISAWWAERLGLEAGHDPGDPWYWLSGGEGAETAGLPWDVVFNAVPEPKTVKNRVHWDVWGVTADYLAAGAALLRERDDRIGWDVLADPEGNEFCVFTR
jgi:hypothetical protein